MTRLLTLVNTIALALSAVGLAAAPAQAATVATVWVDARVNAAWPVTRAVTYVDTYTGSRMRFGRCRSGARCIVIREDGKLPWQWAAVTRPGTPTRINLNPHRRSTTYAQRLHTLVHELGHASGLYTHTPRCSSVMYYAMRCPGGRLAPLTFTAGERRILHRH